MPHLSDVEEIATITSPLLFVIELGAPSASIYKFVIFLTIVLPVSAQLPSNTPRIIAEILGKKWVKVM